MNTTKKSFGDIITERCLLLHLTWEQLAAKSGVSRTTIWRWTSGAEQHPKLESLQAVASALGLSVKSLL